MKIIMLIKTMRYDGGVETSVAALTNSLVAKGHVVYIAAFTDWERDNLMSRLDIPEDNILYLGTLGRNYVSKIIKLRRLVKRYDFDILHTHLFHPGLIGRISVFGLKLGTVATEHSTFFSWWGWRHFVTDRLLATSTEAHIAVSRSVAATLGARTGISPNTIHVIPNAFDANRFMFSSKKVARRGSKRILLIGRLEYAKNIQFAIRIVKALSERHDDIRLSICGDGSQMDELRDMCRVEGLLEKHVAFLGKVNDVRTLMLEHDILLFSSHWEGCPMTIIEAYSVGLPVVATAVPGTIDIVKDGLTGVLVEPGDTEHAAQKIEHILEDDRYRKKLAASALVESSKFHPDVIADKVVKVYEGVLQGK